MGTVATIRDPMTGLDPGDVTAGTEDVKDTRQRILDIALDLFIDQGYDKTSLRQIAERLGHSKAAVYYHFASKDDILMALHLRLHNLGVVALAQLDQGPLDPVTWTKLLEQFIDDMLANRKLFVLHERNRAAFEHLHTERHDAEHEDFETRFKELLGDTAVPLRTRVRLACSIGAIMSGLLLSGEIFSDVPTPTLSEMLQDSVRALLEGT
jgi:AcrR family transcriptional regulator